MTSEGSFQRGGRFGARGNPHQANESAYFVPGARKLSPTGCAQINDPRLDVNRIGYIEDRLSGGLYTLESTF